MIWKRHSTLEQLNAMGEGNMVGLLDIRFEAITDDAIIATMPVDSRTHQPFGLLHGGASVVLAETLGFPPLQLLYPRNNYHRNARAFLLSLIALPLQLFIRKFLVYLRSAQV